ncbi:DUF3899 domain-containing protein [Candidatus Epulonipiscium viviparus]|uniref:DUF3899 domain-containing protein n=1 Tax=Candidatus Epulonipiscium viviparus TaxID=420336 RepID=UPI00016C0F2A|nr:DUF3899 domain-containing protein [Candidatus Epulopiscium viviparus]
MSNKGIIKTVVATLVAALLLMYFIFDFSFSLINIADCLFVVGLCLFFPALIIATGAMDLFDGISFVSSKMFKKHTFKTIYDYKEYKKQKNLYKKNPGKPLLVISLIYIVISLVIASFI